MTIELTKAERERVTHAMFAEMRRQGEEDHTRWGWLDDDNLSNVVIDLKTNMLMVTAAAEAEINRIMAERVMSLGKETLKRAKEAKETTEDPGYRERVVCAVDQWLAEDAEARADDAAWNSAIAEARAKQAAEPQSSGNP